MRALSRSRSTLLAWGTAGLTTLTSVALVSAAILIPAPPAALALIVLVGIGLPMVAAWDLSRITAAARPPLDAAELRRQLDRLPETQHPLGL